VQQPVVADRTSLPRDPRFAGQVAQLHAPGLLGAPLRK